MEIKNDINARHKEIEKSEKKISDLAAGNESLEKTRDERNQELEELEKKDKDFQEKLSKLQGEEFTLKAQKERV